MIFSLFKIIKATFLNKEIIYKSMAFGVKSAPAVGDKLFIINNI